MRQVANGLAYLHSSTPPIIHGDIKSDNVLIDDKGNAVIIDFGLGLVIHNKPMVLERTTSSCENGNPRWLAPELYFEEGAMRSMATDVYAFGCLLLEIATGALPFRKLSNRRVVSALASGIPPVSEKEDYPELPENDDLWALMSMCWNREHQARPHMTWVEAILQS
ncbi:hypothetical protein FRC03_009301 [Tulasnella sp. 419]|nr:hypothetical protein FRC03_009301 [Tulasnella sp. 419]